MSSDVKTIQIVRGPNRQVFEIRGVCVRESAPRATCVFSRVSRASSVRKIRSDISHSAIETSDSGHARLHSIAFVALGLKFAARGSV